MWKISVFPELPDNVSRIMEILEYANLKIVEIFNSKIMFLGWNVLW